MQEEYRASHEIYYYDRTGIYYTSLIRSLAIWFHVDFFYAALVSISLIDLIIITLIYFDSWKRRPYWPFLSSLVLFVIVQSGIVIFDIS